MNPYDVGHFEDASTQFLTFFLPQSRKDAENSQFSFQHSPLRLSVFAVKTGIS
jgi:hypothetical protein